MTDSRVASRYAEVRYVGRDRRVFVATEGRHAGLATLVALLVVPALAGVGLDAGWRSFAAGSPGHFARSAVFLGAACALAVMASAVLFMSYQHSGRAPEVWMAIAFAFVAAWLVIDAIPLVTSSSSVLHGHHQALQVAASFGPLLFGTRAVFGPAIDSRLTAARAGVAAAAALVCSAALMASMSVLDPTRVDLYVPVAGLSTAIALLLVGRRHWRPSASYRVFVLGCFAVTASLPFIGVGDRNRAAWPVPIAMLAGGVAIVGGLRTSSLRLAALTRSILADRLAAAARAEAAETERARREERDHDLRSGLLAIEAVIAGMAISTEDRERENALADVAEETGRLRRMLSSTEPSAEPAALDMRGVLSPLLLLERARGLDVRDDLSTDVQTVVPPDVVVRVMHILLDNVREHAPGSRVEVRAHRSGDRTEVTVRDEGGAADLTDLDRSQRPRIAHRVDSQHHGVGLLSAKRLVEEHGGHFRVDRDEGGGMAFTVDLPAAPGSERLALTGNIPALAVEQIAETLTLQRVVPSDQGDAVIAGRRHTDSRIPRPHRPPARKTDAA